MQGSEVRVWVAHPSAFGEAEREALRLLLDDDQRQRADRLRFEADRHASVIAQGLCRNMLGALAGISPEKVRFTRDAHGKPSAQGAASPWYFSLSHTRGLVACAASLHGPLGIDVEAADAHPQDADVLDLFLRAPEDGVLDQRGASGFYACWTALEAYWKARGTGLTSANPRLVLSRPDGPLQAALEGDPAQASRLFITPIEAADGFAVALACGWVPTLQLAVWTPMHLNNRKSATNVPSYPAAARPLPQFPVVA
jgi:4'-phosphopantetheinyl transferase